MLDATANAYSGDAFDQPAGPWTEIEAAANEFFDAYRDSSPSAVASGSIAGAVVAHVLAKIRYDVCAAIRVEAPTIRLDEIDLKGNKSSVPAWIANRIACIVIVVKYATLQASRPPVFPRVRSLLEAAPCLSELRARPSGFRITGIPPPRLLGRLWRSQQ